MARHIAVQWSLVINAVAVVLLASLPMEWEPRGDVLPELLVVVSGKSPRETTMEGVVSVPWQPIGTQDEQSLNPGELPGWAEMDHASPQVPPADTLVAESLSLRSNASIPAAADLALPIGSHDKQSAAPSITPVETQEIPRPWPKMQLADLADGEIPRTPFYFPETAADRLKMKAKHFSTTHMKKWYLEIEGVATEAESPFVPPVQSIDQDRFFFHAGAAAYTWNSPKKKLHRVGDCLQHQVPGLGSVIIRENFATKTVEIIDFPPESSEPRVLWTEHGETSYGFNEICQPLGMWDGALVCSLDEARLLFLLPGWSHVREYELGGYRWNPSKYHLLRSHDLIRHGKLLIFGPPVPSNRWRIDFTVALPVLNLQTGEIKPLGKVPGRSTAETTRVWVEWVTHRRACQLKKPPQGPVWQLDPIKSYVDEANDELITCRQR